VAVDVIGTKFDKAHRCMTDAIQTLLSCTAIAESGMGQYRSSQADLQMAAALTAQHSINSLSELSSGQLFQLPHSNVDRFVGREGVLDAIHSALKPKPPFEQKYFSIYGIGGMGKSQVALAYAERHMKYFDAILWVHAESGPSLLQSYTDIAMRLKIDGASLQALHTDNRDLFLTWLLQNSVLTSQYDSLLVTS
jgi:hypothetical protein